ncbi:MAG: hypothetical protein FWG84_04130 [Bacteroidales bacterium]|nr:hypothetical protein [Bacteroidales bacterium]
METFAIRYNPKNMVITKFLEALSGMRGVEVLQTENEFTLEDLQEIEKARKSDICKDITKLEELLISKL